MLNKSIFLLAVRILPLVLILTLSIFWSNEKNLRLSLEKKVDETLDQLLESENRLQSLASEVGEIRKNLEIAEKEAQESQEERYYLITQLGERDEHIRRLLAEMIQLLSGTQDVNLGTIKMRNKPEVWRGVHNELTEMMSSPSIGRSMEGMSGMRQVAVETKSANPNRGVIHMMPKTGPQNNNMVTKKIQVVDEMPKPARMMTSVPSKMNRVEAPMGGIIEGEILVVNKEHNFVVINKGLEHGLSEGMELVVTRSGKTMGRVIIETAYEKISAADVVFAKAADLKVGDFISSQLTQ